MKSVILSTVILLSGCTITADLVNKTTDELAKAADQYCLNTIGQVRATIREETNRKLEVAKSAQIDC